jgi:Domain of unknown function (DUF4349)
MSGSSSAGSRGICVRRARQAVAGAAVAAGLLVATTACSGDSGTAAGSSASAGSPQSVTSPRDEAPADGSASTASGGSGSTRDSSSGESAPKQGSNVLSPVALPSSDYLVRRAQLSLKVTNVAQAAAKVRAASATAGGMVVSENIGAVDPQPETGTERPGPLPATTYGEITVSVPADRLDAFLDNVSRLGTLLSRQSSSQDVKQQYVDTESRLRTMRASVARVRALMARATTINQIVTLEAELSRREADLESLESQLAALKDSIARSPVQVSLTTDAAVVTPAETGFLAGLQRGWEAFTASLTVLVTGLGALLPFAVLAALVGIPLVVWLRRRRTASPAPAPGSASTSGAAPSA